MAFLEIVLLFRLTLIVIFMLLPGLFFYLYPAFSANSPFEIVGNFFRKINVLAANVARHWVQIHVRRPTYDDYASGTSVVII
jgi:hypothetical protein